MHGNRTVSVSSLNATSGLTLIFFFLIFFFSVFFFFKSKVGLSNTSSNCLFFFFQTILRNLQKNNKKIALQNLQGAGSDLTTKYTIHIKHSSKSGGQLPQAGRRQDVEETEMGNQICTEKWKPAPEAYDLRDLVQEGQREPAMDHRGNVKRHRVAWDCTVQVN